MLVFGGRFHSHLIKLRRPCRREADNRAVCGYFVHLEIGVPTGEDAGYAQIGVASENHECTVSRNPPVLQDTGESRSAVGKGNDADILLRALCHAHDVSVNPR